MAVPHYARDIMARKLIKVRPDMDVFDAIELLVKHRISGVPVVNSSGQYVGVFSDLNCLSMVVNAAYDQLPSTRVETFMATDNPTIGEDDDIYAIAQVFTKTSARRLPVLRGDELVGQVSRRDVLAAIHKAVKGASTTESQLLYLSSLTSRDQSPVR
jgi:CBS domain-containing protein